MERVISISETAKREANNKNNENESEKSITFLLRVVTVSDSFLIKDKEA